MGRIGSRRGTGDMLADYMEQASEAGQMMESELPPVRRGPGKMLVPRAARTFFGLGKQRRGQFQELLVGSNDAAVPALGQPAALQDLDHAGRKLLGVTG